MAYMKLFSSIIDASLSSSLPFTALGLLFISRSRLLNRLSISTIASLASSFVVCCFTVISAIVFLPCISRISAEGRSIPGGSCFFPGFLPSCPVRSPHSVLLLLSGFSLAYIFCFLFCSQSPDQSYVLQEPLPLRPSPGCQSGC